MEVKERGAASISVELTGGVITVKHGEGGAVLASWVANEGDWEKLWDTINGLKLLAGDVERWLNKEPNND